MLNKSAQASKKYMLTFGLFFEWDSVFSRVYTEIWWFSDFSHGNFGIFTIFIGHVISFVLVWFPVWLSTHDSLLAAQALSFFTYIVTYSVSHCWLTKPWVKSLVWLHNKFYPCLTSCTIVHTLFTFVCLLSYFTNIASYSVLLLLADQRSSQITCLTQCDPYHFWQTSHSFRIRNVASP